MDVDLIFKIAAVGILVAVLNGLENDGVITLFPKRELPLPEDAQKRKKRPLLKK